MGNIYKNKIQNLAYFTKLITNALFVAVDKELISFQNFCGLLYCLFEEKD